MSGEFMVTQKVICCYWSMSNVLQQIEDKIKEWTINIKFVVGLPGLLHSVVLCLTCIMYPVIYLYSSILLQSNYTCNTYANEGKWAWYIHYTYVGNCLPPSVIDSITCGCLFIFRGKVILTYNACLMYLWVALYNNI